MAYYAVAKGKHGTVILDNWEECKEHVIGFSGAIYKGFTVKSQAEEFIKKHSPKEVETHNIEAYCDGSFNSGTYGYGVVILESGKVIHESYGGQNRKDYRDMRNVAGELLGALYVLKYCIDNNIEKFTLYYDYEGIEKWATGYWNANNEMSKLYKKLTEKKVECGDITFKKIKSHTGDKYNERADILAKKGVGLNV